MVKKPQRRIASKPTPPPAADEWVSSGGVDPEVQQSVPSPSEPEPEPEQEEKGKTFPHRISFDTDTPQYKRLKRAAFEENRAMNEILREAVEDWLEIHKH